MRRWFVFLLLFLACCSPGLSADKTWVGGVSSNWFDADNWTPPGAPDPSHSVEITNFTTVVLTGNLSLASLELRRATLVVSNQLTVSNLFMSESCRINAWQVRPTPVVPPPPGHGIVEIPEGGRLQFGPGPIGGFVFGTLEGTRLNLRGYGFCTNRTTLLMFFRSELNIYGTLELTDEFNFDGGNGPPPGSVNNFGTLLRSAGTNLNFLIAFTNRASVHVESGTMRLASGANSGVMNISLNATQSFQGTPFSWEAGGTFTGPGPVHFVRGQFDAGTNNVLIPRLLWTGTELRGTNTYTIQNGTWDFGTAQAGGELHVSDGGSLTVRTSNEKMLYRRLVNFGKLTLSTNAGLYFFGSSASLINRNAMELGPGAVLYGIAAAPPPPTVFVLNQGQLTCLEGSTSQISVRFTNANRFRVDGQVTLFDPVSVQSAGITTVNGTLVTALFAGSYYIRGGVLEGNGVVRGRVRNAAILAPGASIGQLTIDGSLTNVGTIEIELGVDSTGPVADKLVVTNHLRLGGRLSVLRFGSTWPEEGTSWEVLRFGSVSSNFYAMIGLDLGGGRVLQPVWSPTNLVLTLMHQPVEKFRLQTIPGRASQLELRLTVDPDTAWSLDASSNLLDWTSLLTTNSPDGVLYFNESMSLPRRFYRARQLP